MATHGRSNQRGGTPALLAMLAFAACIGGCTALQPLPAEHVTLHVLSAQPLRTATLPKLDVLIEVSQPRAWPGFDTAQMIYVRGPYTLDHFAVSRWADTPPRMLAPLLARALEESGGFRAVVQAPSPVPPDFRVDTEIVRLQQRFATQPSRVELAVRVQLTDVRGKRVAPARTFEETQSAPTEDAAGGVVAANAALDRMLVQLVEYCAAQAAGR